MASPPAPFTRQFPLEILHLALKEMLPPVLRVETFPVHARQLCDLALVNSAFRAWAQRELFRRAYLRDHRSSQRLITVLQNASALGQVVRKLQVRYLDYCEPDGELIAELLRHTPNLEELFLSDVERFELASLAATFSESSCGRLTVLRRPLTDRRIADLANLVIWSGTLIAEVSGTLHLPRLTQLSICAPDTVGGHLGDFLSPSVLASLRALAFITVDQSLGPEDSVFNPTRLETILPPLEPQLDVLVRGCNDYRSAPATSSLPTLWAHGWYQLEGKEEEDLLEIWHRQAQGAAHALRPVTGPVWADFPVQTFLDALQEPSPALLQLKELWVPTEVVKPEIGGAAWTELEALCIARGIEVHYELHDSMEDSQITLEFWKMHMKA